MKAGIVGLGLIGGSLAKAYAEHDDITVYGCDTDASTIAFAKLAGVIDGELNEETAPLCDIILIAVPPVASVKWLEEMAPYLNENSLVVDCCGTKRVVCNACFPLAEKYGFTFVGGHPMAGTQYAGFKNSKVDMFKGERMVIVPPRFDDIRLLDKVKKLLEPVGFGTFSISTAEIFYYRWKTPTVTKSPSRMVFPTVLSPVTATGSVRFLLWSKTIAVSSYVPLRTGSSDYKL